MLQSIGPSAPSAVGASSKWLGNARDTYYPPIQANTSGKDLLRLFVAGAVFCLQPSNHREGCGKGTAGGLGIQLASPTICSRSGAFWRRNRKVNE